MKKVLGILAAVLFLALVVGTGVFLFKKSAKKPVVYRTETPTRTDIVKKTVATGSVVPRKEIAVKPQISGIVDELYIEAGQIVKQGDLVAKVRVIPNMVSLSAAEARVNQAQIALENAARENERQKRLFAEGTVAQADAQRADTAWKTAQEEVAAAKDNIDIVRKGTSARVGSATNTIIRAPISGMVLQVPIEVGNSVIEANNFNDGTTLATLADMDDMIFKGKVDESEVGKIKPGMALVLTIGAIENKKIEASLERIAPKGVEENGAIQFEIRAAIKPQHDVFLRANYSANADIVLDKRSQVLAIPESVLQFDGAKPFVEVETKPQTFEKRSIKTGLSDGIQIEVLEGLTESDKVKNPNTDLQAAPAKKG
ncbi:MAG: efflux RND transporter periplasmic adaptor subunit [Acidobacteriota bacterium]